MSKDKEGKTGANKSVSQSDKDKQKQWDSFDKSLDRAFGKKKGDGSNRD